MGLCGESAEDGTVAAGGGGGRWAFTAVDENDLAGFGDGVAVNGKTAMDYQMVDDGFGCSGGVRFALGQPVAQMSRAMPRIPTRSVQLHLGSRAAPTSGSHDRYGVTVTVTVLDFTQDLVSSSQRRTWIVYWPDLLKS
jgi:hypothetical protein